jgi:hypothetical protein
VLKLVVAEDESDALAARLDTRGADTPVIASILLYTEAHRVAHREDISSELVDDVLARISLVSAPDEIFVRAASFTGHMRSIDASTSRRPLTSVRRSSSPTTSSRLEQLAPSASS